MRFRLIGALSMGLFLSIVTTAAASVQQVTTPEQQFGHEIGADYELVNYTELYDYFTKLAGESDRMTVEDIGLTEEGRPQVMAVITRRGEPLAPVDLALDDRDLYPGDQVDILLTFLKESQS